MHRPNAQFAPHRSEEFPRALLGMLVAAAGFAHTARADVWSWTAGDGFWMSPGNWSQNSVPGLDHTDWNDIRIGDQPGVGNSTVLMNNPVGSGSLSFDYLGIFSGMTLDMNGRQLGSLTGGIHIAGPNSRLIVRSSTDLNFHDLNAAQILLGSDSHLNLLDNGAVRASSVNSVGIISGQGAIYFGVGDTIAALRNSGIIAGASNGGLTLFQEATARLDLDGLPAVGAEIGQLSLASPFAMLTVQGDQLTDSFSSTVTMGTGSLLNMNLSNGWTADAGSTFNVSSSMLGAAAQIAGGHFTFGGDLNIGGAHGNLRVLADATVATTADVFLGNDDRLEFDGATTVQGGVYTVSSGGRIDFDGPAEIGGGSFNLVGASPALGSVNFNGDTTWSGTTTINGLARQYGDATVLSPTSINATVLDMDGNNNAAWTINHGLTVNAQAIEVGSQQFDGTLNMNVGAIGRLTVNLDDPAASWTMNGTMNLAGFGMLTTTRIAGSRVIVSGVVNMGTGIAQFTSDAAFQGASVSIDAGGVLRMRGVTTVDAATMFSGDGVLHNGLGGTMTFDSGVALSSVGLTNSGAWGIVAGGAGAASVSRAVLTDDSVWTVDIGGFAAPDRDFLLVTGADGATLGGLISVSLLNLDAGFSPQVGDEFRILSALAGGATGAFINDPVTHAGGRTYEWTVLYDSHNVILRLDNIVPSPGTLALLGLGSVVFRRQRRS